MSGPNNGPPLRLPYSGHHKPPHRSEPSLQEDVRKRPKEKTQVRFPACPLFRQAQTSQVASLNLSFFISKMWTMLLHLWENRKSVGVSDFCRYHPGILTAKSQNISPRRVLPQGHRTPLYPHPTLNMQVSSSWLK